MAIKKDTGLLGKLIRVEWHDHWSESTYEYLKPEQFTDDALITSIGVVVLETPDRLYIANHRDRDGAFAATTAIWKAMIDRVEEIV